MGLCLPSLKGAHCRSCCELLQTAWLLHLTMRQHLAKLVRLHACVRRLKGGCSRGRSGIRAWQTGCRACARACRASKTLSPASRAAGPVSTAHPRSTRGRPRRPPQARPLSATLSRERPPPDAHRSSTFWCGGAWRGACWLQLKPRQCSASIQGVQALIISITNQPS